MLGDSDCGEGGYQEYILSIRKWIAACVVKAELGVGQSENGLAFLCLMVSDLVTYLQGRYLRRSPKQIPQHPRPRDRPAEAILRGRISLICGWELRTISAYHTEQKVWGSENIGKKYSHPKYLSVSGQHFHRFWLWECFRQRERAWSFDKCRWLMVSRGAQWATPGRI